MNKAKFWFQAVISGIYKWVTGREPSIDSARVSFLFFGLASRLIFAKALVMIATILTGNLLGAQDFGYLAIILAVGNFWCLPLFTCWGLAYVKFTSENGDVRIGEDQLSAALLIAMFTVALVIPILLVFRKTFAGIFGIPPDIWSWGCVFGFLMGAYYFSKNVFQATQKWSHYATCEFLFSISLTVGVLLLRIVNPSDRFDSVIGVFILAHLVGIIYVSPVILHSLHLPKIDNLTRMAWYGLGLFVSFGISLLSLQMDRIIINYYADSETVGRYQAYYTSTFTLLNSFSTLLNSYLLPLYGQYSKEIFGKTLIHFLLVTALPLWIGCFLAGRLVFMLFGKSFDFKWIYLIWASTFSVIFFALQTLIFFSMTLGKKYLIYNLLVYTVFITMQLISMPFLIPRYGLTGAFQSMALASLVGFLIIWRIISLLSVERKAGL